LGVSIEDFRGYSGRFVLLKILAGSPPKLADCVVGNLRPVAMLMHFSAE